MSTYKVIRTFLLRDDNIVFDIKMAPLDIAGGKVNVTDVDDEPVNGEITHPISSNWAYDYVKEKEEEQVLRDLETVYNGMMANERHTSNRRGYEIR